MIQRQNYVVIISPESKERIKNNQCPNCGLHKNKWTRRKDWRCCSKKCTEEFLESRIIYGWPDLRRKAFKRDKYTCRECGFTSFDKKEINEYYNFDYYKSFLDIFNVIYLEDDVLEYVIVGDGSKLIGDHIKPIAIGGKEFNINNVQTLCIECNRKKTKKDQKIIAMHRRAERNNMGVING